jgi:thymidine kinase
MSSAIRNTHSAAHDGHVEVICGPMFCGKTEELIRRLRRAAIARQRVRAFKPAIDRRYHPSRISSHGSAHIEADPVLGASSILPACVEGTQVVGIDEAQFFGNDLLPVVAELADRGIRVIVAGLDQDHTGKPFEPVPQLLAVAEVITKLDAVCVVCGGIATRSYRTAQTGDRVLVGATERFQARCRRCHKLGEGAAARVEG